ncbi:MAG: FAD-dependent oxidoreductase, partial [Methylotenera sp.]
DREIVDRRRLVEIEPALALAANQLVGGTYTPTDESGDARKFTQGLAEIIRLRGVDFLYSNCVLGLDPDARDSKIRTVLIGSKAGTTTIAARHFVVAMGSWSAPFLKPYGIDLPVYPAKGYSITIPLHDVGIAPVVSLTDDEHKLVYSNLGNRLRVAGMAEIDGYNTEIDARRSQTIIQQAQALFPMAGPYQKAEIWAGLRPATPSNLPCIGPTPYRNLWVNTGHGTLGWTLAAGSGNRIATLITDAMAERRRPPQLSAIEELYPLLQWPI